MNPLHQVSSVMVLHLHFENASQLEAPLQADFEQWAKTALTGHEELAELCIRLVSAAESAQLNQQYRGKHGATNVLSFPAELPEGVDSTLLGDLAICTEIVEQEALAQNKNPQHHWAHMVIHGCLHLLGFDHQTDSEAEAMESLEVQLLGKLDIDNPYQLVTPSSIEGQAP